MSGSNHLREGDIDALLRLIEDARHDDPGEAFPWELLQGLRRLIPCDDQAVVYNNLDFREHRVVLAQCLDEEDRPCLDRQEGPEPEAEPFWEYFWESHCSYPQRTGDLRSVIQTADFHPTAADRARDRLSEILDATHTMIVSMPAAPGQLRRIVFFRFEDLVFSERDRQVLALLRPHLQEIWLDAERRRAGVPQLTPREWQVLGMAGAGLSYADIASALFVSIATVRKHMEHVRERLGVHSVMAAAAVALPHAPAQAGHVPPRPRATADPPITSSPWSQA